MIYEEEDSKIQLNYLTLIINTLQNMKNMTRENYDTLSTKTCQYSSKLLRKPDQCRAALYAYHFDKDNDKVTAEYINGLIDLIANNISKIEEEETPDDVFAPTIINAKIAI